MTTQSRSIGLFIVAIGIITLLLWTAFNGLTFFDWQIHSSVDPDYGIRRGLDLIGGSVIVYEAKDVENPNPEEMATVVSMLQERMTRMGYSEATAATQGANRVRVEIPSIKDPEKAVQELGAAAHLTFVDADGNILVDGTEVKDAKYQYAPIEANGRAVSHVQLTFTEKGRQEFLAATTKVSSPDYSSQQKNYISIMMDDVPISSPRVEKPIDSDSCIISGEFDAESATALANNIRSGKLPFTLVDVELSSVGPTLGENALNTSLYAGGIGILLVLLFMLIFYRMFGLVADIALCAYISLVLLIMGGTILPATRVNLTLPGIAGIILSIGMAVDANVIIFERIREELKLGKSIGSSIESGFKRAFTAILDSNVTTLIAAFVLLYFGTGTIRGFAITLGIGVIISMFSAIFITRFLLKLMIGMGIKNPKLYTGMGGAENV